MMKIIYKDKSVQVLFFVVRLPMALLLLVYTSSVCICNICTKFDEMHFSFNIIFRVCVFVHQ